MSGHKPKINAAISGAPLTTNPAECRSKNLRKGEKP